MSKPRVLTCSAISILLCSSVTNPHAFHHHFPSFFLNTFPLSIRLLFSLHRFFSPAWFSFPFPVCCSSICFGSLCHHSFSSRALTRSYFSFPLFILGKRLRYADPFDMCIPHSTHMIRADASLDSNLSHSLLWPCFERDPEVFYVPLFLPVLLQSNFIACPFQL